MPAWNGLMRLLELRGQTHSSPNNHPIRPCGGWGLITTRWERPLYWVKPAEAPKLIGAWQFLFVSDFLRDNYRIYCGFKNVGYRLGSDRGRSNQGSTLFSNRVMAQIRSPARVRT
jgi:hypothetical protein